MDLELLHRMIAYADDCDFVTDDPHLIDRIQAEAPEILNRWNLKMNITKSEFTRVEKCEKCQEEYWRNTKKLGSLLGDPEDVSRRKNLAKTAMSNLWKLWFNKNSLDEKLRIRIYNAYIKPVLIYNSGTWGLTNTKMKGLESFHRSQLRRVLGVYHPEHVSNATVYLRSECLPLRYDLLQARWRCFRRILCSDPEIPANLEMGGYFKCEEQKWLGRKTMCLPLCLHKDLQMIDEKLLTLKDFHHYRGQAQDPMSWIDIINRLLEALMKKYEEEERKRLERKESNNSGHANPLYDSDIDEE
jgi:hypothetical protein